jgi:hypothetical protein
VSNVIGNKAKSSRKDLMSDAEIRLRFSPTSKALNTSCAQKAGTMAAPPRLRVQKPAEPFPHVRQAVLASTTNWFTHVLR